MSSNVLGRTSVTCCVCMDSTDCKDVNFDVWSCSNTHADGICENCRDILISHQSDCPICRAHLLNSHPLVSPPYMISANDIDILFDSNYINNTINNNTIINNNINNNSIIINSLNNEININNINNNSLNDDDNNDLYNYNILFG
jgi:hypothetical protein